MSKEETNEKYPLRQFKLSSGDEIVCEVIQWQNEEELELIVRKPMRIGSLKSWVA